MNERIKELAEQVGITENNLSDGDMSHDDLKKFAKLIIRECAGIYCSIDNGNLHMGTDDYLEALHKTFRSEE